MSLSKWKKLAAEKTKTGEMKQNLFDEITAKKIRSKTTDKAIAKTFRLDRLDRIAEKTKPKAKRGVRFQIPRINRDGDIDYAPEVDPYEYMDVEGLFNLEDYVAPGAEKRIAKMPKEEPKYEMDPSFFCKFPLNLGHLGHLSHLSHLGYQGSLSRLNGQRSQKIQVIYNFLKRKKK